jgi:aspartate/methionine/tyrosine aminotransferase
MDFNRVEMFHFLREADKKAECCIFGSDVPPVSPEDFDLRWEDILLGDDEDHSCSAGARGIIAERYGVSPDMVMTTGGSTIASFMTMATIFKKPGSAMIEKPVYTPLQDALNVFTNDVRSLPRWREDNWTLDLEQLDFHWDPSVRVVVLVNFNNPTGGATPDDVIKVIADKVAQTGGYVLVDEVFREFYFDRKPGCAASVAPNVITVSSFSKSFGFGFQRFGWFIGPPELLKEMQNIADYFAIGGHFPAAMIIQRAIENIEMLKERSRKFVDEGRAVFEEWLASRDDIECVMPEAGPFAFPVLKDEGDSDEICEKLLVEESTLVAPGRFFGYPPGFRIGYGRPVDLLKKGFQSLSKVLDERRSSG